MVILVSSGQRADFGFRIADFKKERTEAREQEAVSSRQQTNAH